MVSFIKNTLRLHMKPNIHRVHGKSAVFSQRFIIHYINSILWLDHGKSQKSKNLYPNDNCLYSYFPVTNLHVYVVNIRVVVCHPYCTKRTPHCLGEWVVGVASTQVLLYQWARIDEDSWILPINTARQSESFNLYLDILCWWAAKNDNHAWLNITCCTFLCLFSKKQAENHSC